MNRQRRPVSRLVGTLGRRFVLITLLFASIGFISGLVVFSPFFLDVLKSRRDDWMQLRNIGQTYGVASALLSVSP